MQYEGQFLISVFILPNGFQNVLYLNARQTQPSSNASTTRDLLLKMVNYLRSLVSMYSTLIGHYARLLAKLDHFQNALGLYFCSKSDNYIGFLDLQTMVKSKKSTVHYHQHPVQLGWSGVPGGLVQLKT